MVAVLLVASACGGTVERDYDATVRTAFLETCQSIGSGPWTCAANLECVEKQLTQEEYEYEENWILLRNELSDRMTDVMATCLSEQGDERILFVSDRDGDFEIFVMNPDGMDVHQLTHNEAMDLTPDWSPDGSRIVFVSNREVAAGDGDHAAVFVMNADGTRQSQINDSDRWRFSPRWSPDGERFVYAQRDDGDADLRVVKIDGTEVRQLTRSDTWDQNPTWSPDGDRIAFVASSDDCSGTVMIMDVEDGVFADMQQLTDHNGCQNQGTPAWSPDGLQIAFTERSDIWVISPDGTGAKNLTSNTHMDSGSTWSPDGERIAFTSDRFGDPEILVMDASGNDVYATGQSGWVSSWVD